MFKGSLLDLEKLVSQLKRSEKARLETEARMMEIQHDLNSVNDRLHKQSSTMKDVTDDLKNYKDRLRSTDEKLKKTTVICLFKLSSRFHLISYLLFFLFLFLFAVRMSYILKRFEKCVSYNS